MQKIIPHLWYDKEAKEAKEAEEYYTDIFEDSKIINIYDRPMFVDFQIFGIDLKALSGGPYFKLNEAFSLMLMCNY